MASPRATSPAGDVSAPTSPKLTPRSKLKAMLAAVDEGSSDDDNTDPIDAKSLFAAINKNKQKLSLPQASEDDSADEEDKEEAEIVRPRGRMAARMHASFQKTDQAPKGESADQQILPIMEEERHEQGQDDNDDDGEDIVVPLRRRPANSYRASTPVTTAPINQDSSPSLFVSPSAKETTSLDHNLVAPDSDDGGDDSDDDVPVDLSKNARFKALVEKKKKERLDREAEEERKRLDRAQQDRDQLPAQSDEDEDDVSDISDDDGGRKLTQEVSRPSRKATKKALEEMNRETQRMSRSLQLAHEAKTKKKISKDTLFKRFNFQTERSVVDKDKMPNSSRPTTPGSFQQNDLEPEGNGTPPSSPPAAPKENPSLPDSVTLLSKNNITMAQDKSKNCGTLEAAMPQSKTHDGQKEETTDQLSSATDTKPSVARKPVRQVRVKLPVQIHTTTAESDDELVVANPTKKDKIGAIFSRIPENKAQESTGMKILRNLAHLSSPPKESTRGRNVKPGMTFGELHMTLQQRAKSQAKLERERRLEVLRSKGIIVQSAEEREREREEVEDMVSRARQEVEEIMLREREEAKRTRKEKKEAGKADPLAWDDSDDDSFQGSEDEESKEVELSGSEDEAANESEEEVEDGEQAINDLSSADKAKETKSGDEEAPATVSDGFSDEDVEDMKRPAPLRSRRSKRQVQVTSDDDDDDDDGDHVIATTPKAKRIVPKSPSMLGSDSPKPPTSVLRSATKTFIPGLPIAAAAPAGMGLTQIFAGTMDDSQRGPFNGTALDFMPSINQFPDSQFSSTAGQSQDNGVISDSQPIQIANSQECESQTQAVQLNYSQSQTHGFDSLLQDSATPMSDFVDPTQDGGFQDHTPLKQRFVDAPPSTANTVLLSGAQEELTIQESPLVRKRGKLLRRTELDGPTPTILFAEKSGDPQPSSATQVEASSGEGNVSSDAFRLMEKAAKRERRLKKKFDRKKSKATEMIEEQAEESEDEYAGLGGADGEDSSDEDDELIREMIDDTKGNDIDAAELAGLFADRERAADAAQVDKLFRDITTGMLRKRRRGGDGHDFDLSDSDDGGEARRQMKRRQFAKMQKALFKDERIGKIAENPRNAAFLKSIEDRDNDEDFDFCDNFAADGTSASGDDSQSQNTHQADQAVPDSQPPTTGRKRTRTDEHISRPGPSERRIRDGDRATSIAEVRRSLSALLDEHNGPAGSIIPATEAGSDGEEEDERPSTSRSDKENHRPSRRTGSAVVDRITLKRNSSSLSATGSTSTTAKLAFTAPSTTGSGFKVPALLRRATTNSTKLVSSASTGVSSSSNSTGEATASSSSGSLNKAPSFSEDGKLKKNAGKRSGINYFAHENERRAKVADAEKRREAKKWKGAEGRSKVVGSLFGSGSFE